MLILTIDAALAHCDVSLICDDAVVSAFREDGRRGQARLAWLAQEALARAGPARARPDLIAVSIGPGSFTGIRAALSLGQGIGLALRVPVIGVTVGEALGEALAPLEQRRLWCAIAGRQGRVFLEEAGLAASYSLDALPHPSVPVGVAGDAAIRVAASLAARGVDVLLTAVRNPSALHLAMAATKRHSGDLPPRATQPLYVDQPEAKLPLGGLRPCPISGAFSHGGQDLR